MNPRLTRSTRGWQLWLFRLLASGLVALHAWLLARRIASGDGFADPEALLRWLGTAALLFGVLLWRRVATRRGWVRPRRGATVFWVVAALLHVGIGVPPTELQGETASVLLAILAAWSFLNAARVQPPRTPRGHALRELVRSTSCIDPARGSRCAPRPPPLPFA